MPRGFGRLPFFGRRSNRPDPSPNAAALRGPIDPDLAPLGPPRLLPSAIIRQVLFDATEVVPVWAMPRAESARVAPPIEPNAPKRPRRARATAKPAAKPASAKPPTAKPRSHTRKASGSS